MEKGYITRHNALDKLQGYSVNPYIDHYCH